MKLERYDGEVPIFSEDYEGRERTIFGSVTESNDINDQFTPEFMRGWGIVGDTEFPTLQDFNALGFTHGKLISYLYQAGIPSYTANEKYYPGSIAQYNNDIYLCTATEPTSLPTNTRDWVKWQSSLGELAQIRADKNGFLLNKAGTYNALIDTDLVRTTGQSQTKIMTQKAVTDALGQKQNNLTFVGTGPEVMRKGAFGVGLSSIPTPAVIQNTDNRSQFYGYASSSTSPFGVSGNVVRLANWNHIQSEVLISPIGDIRVRYVNTQQEWQDHFAIFSEKNTRTDKNNVLHAGTGTPINTLNVSDMNQDVIDNDNLTVTSGAVYRALLPKRDLTNNGFSGAIFTNYNGGSAELGLSPQGVTFISVIRGGVAYYSNLPLKSGTIAHTSDLIGVGQSWQNVTGSRVGGTTYTNNTGKPIMLSILKPGNNTSVGDLYVGSVRVGVTSSGAIAMTVSTIVPAGNTYRFTSNEFEAWSELR